MFIVSPSTVTNAHALETRNVPKRMIGRIAVIPRRGASLRTVARLVFEVQILRYLAGLLPFVIAMLIWPHLALPISQAPVPMLIVLMLIETKVLTLTPAARKQIVSDAAMARTRDALQFNATRILSRIAAARQMQKGELLLVIEQSEIARVPPLTLVSIQQSFPEPMVLDLSPAERALITETLFDDTLTERALHHVSLREGENLRSIALDVSTLSAHARMAALMEARRTAPELAEA